MQRTVFAGIAAMAAMTSVAAVRLENDLQDQQYVEVDTEIDTGIDTGIDTEIGTKVDAEVDAEVDTEIGTEGDKYLCYEGRMSGFCINLAKEMGADTDQVHTRLFDNCRNVFWKSHGGTNYYGNWNHYKKSIKACEEEV